MVKMDEVSVTWNIRSLTTFSDNNWEEFLQERQNKEDEETLEPMRSRSSAVLEVCSNNGYDLTLLDEDSFSSADCLKDSDSASVMLFTTDLILFKESEMVHVISLKNIDELVFYERDVGHVKNCIVARVHYHNNDGIEVRVKFGFLGAPEDVGCFVKQLCVTLYPQLIHKFECEKCFSTFLLKYNLQSDHIMCSSCSELNIWQNKMDSFPNMITALQPDIERYLNCWVFDCNEEFKQMAKGYLSRSDDPSIVMCAIVITSTKIRFFEIKPDTDKKDLQSIKSWFVPIASYVYSDIKVMEKGLSGQNLLFKMKNYTECFVFVAFSCELISSIVDIITEKCVQANWTICSTSDNTSEIDSKMFNKHVISKLKRLDVTPESYTKWLPPPLSMPDTLFDLEKQLSASDPSQCLQKSWICRVVGFDNSLILLALTEDYISISNVNFFVAHHTDNALKAKPFVLLDGRIINDIIGLCRYSARRNVVTVHFSASSFNATATITSSKLAESFQFTNKFDQFNPNLDSVQWHLKLGSMRDVSELSKSIRVQWEETNQTKLPEYVDTEIDINSSLMFFDD